MFDKKAQGHLLVPAQAKTTISCSGISLGVCLLNDTSAIRWIAQFVGCVKYNNVDGACVCGSNKGDSLCGCGTGP